MQENPWCRYLEMGKVSHPVLEIMVGAINVSDRERMSAVTELPIETGMDSMERSESKGVSCFLRGF